MATDVCRREHQSTGEPPSVTSHPVVERPVFGHCPQSASDHASNTGGRLAGNVMPSSDVVHRLTRGSNVRRPDAGVSRPTEDPAIGLTFRSASNRAMASRTYSQRRQQLRCCGCLRRSWTALPESLCWLVCTSDTFFHSTTFASSRNTLSSESTLDRLHTLHHRDVLPMGGVTEYLIRTCASIGSTSSHSHMRCYADL